MSENLQFGFDHGRMCLDVPHDLMGSALARSRSFSYIMNLTEPERQVIGHRMGDDSTRLLFRTKKIGQYSRLMASQKSRQAVSVIDSIVTHTPDSRQDPRLLVEMGLEPMGTSDRYGFHARVMWPESDMLTAAKEATHMMRRTAHDLRHAMSKRSLNDMVYAQLDRNRGMTLETNPIASASLDTDGDSYSPEDEAAELWAHNLYSHQMQLICLSGLIAIARSR